MRMLETCHVANWSDGCEGVTTGKCYRCGLPTCTACRKPLIINGSRRRLCLDCCEELRRDVERRQQAAQAAKESD